MAVEHDGAGVWPELAVDHVEAGGLAGAVRPQQRQQLAGGQVKRDIGYRGHAAVGLLQISYLEQAHHCTSSLSKRLRMKPTMPCGKVSTSSRMMPPNSARQYSVSRASRPCSQVKTTPPTSGPVSVCTPPSSTMTRPSTERPTEMVSGEMLPLEKANSAPATPQNRPASTKAIHCTRLTSMPMASLRSSESRPARIA